MAEAAVRRATYADLEAVPETMVAEIIDGALQTHPRPRPPHVTAAAELASSLVPPFRRGRGGPGGWIFMIEPELHLGQHVVVPDLAGWRRDRMSNEPSAAFIDIAPDWICEILSPSTSKLDRGPKRRIYAEAGVEHLWLLDPIDRQLECFFLAAGQWLLTATIQSGEMVDARPFEAAPFAFDDLFPFDEPPSSPSSEA